MGITIAVTRTVAQIAGGNQDITTADLGGLTPLAVWLNINYAITDGTAADHAVFGYGAATDTTERWACCVRSQHGVNPSSTGRRQMTDECCMITFNNVSTVDGEADFVQFIANGVRINWGNAPAAAYFITATFFAGTDLQAYAGTFALGNVNVETDVNTVGFEPDVLLTVTAGYDFDDASATQCRPSHGVVTNNDAVYQASSAERSNNNVSPTQISSRITETYGVMQIESTGAVFWGGDFGSFDANGFSCWPRINNANCDVGFLALNFGGVANFEANVIDSPIANGNWTVNDPGFEPQYVHMGLTQMAAIDTSYADSNAGSFGVSTFDADDEYCNSIQDEDNQATSDTQSLSDNQAINLPDDDGTAAWVASFVGFTGTGWTLNFTASEGTAVKWWYLGVGEAAQTIIPTPPTPPTAPTVVIVPTAPSLHQMTGLSVSVFKPVIDTSASPVSYLADGEFVQELREEIGRLRFGIAAFGGYDKANFTISDRQSRIERWLEEGLGQHIEIYNPSLEEIWSGMVNKIAVNLGVLSATRGPLLDAPNRVSLIYSTMDTSTNPPVLGERTKTAAVNDTDAQTRYAIIEKVLSAGGVTATDATQIRNTYLAENAWPMTSQRVSERGREPSVTVECVGYYHWLTAYVYNQIVNTGTQNLSAKLQAVIDAQLNTTIRSHDIVTNTLAVNQFENDDKTGLSLIKELVAMGDANDARYLFGVYAKREAIYEAAPTTEIAYQQRLADPDQRIETLIGDEVEPWDVLPGRWLFFPDFLVGTAQPVQRRLDPRFMFIESTQFTAPDGISLKGGKVDELTQKLARMGLAGVGG